MTVLNRSIPYVYVYNVLSYGATGDGSTNDTTAIRNAITAAGSEATRGVVYFPKGQYKHDGLTLSVQGVSLVGEGRRESVLAYTGSGSAGAKHGVYIDGAHNVRIMDLQLHGHADMTSGLRVRNAANCALHRVHVTGNGAVTDGIILEGSTYYALIDDCMVDGAGASHLAAGITFKTNVNTPNSNVVRSVRIQDCTTGVDLQSGDNNLLEAVRCEVCLTTGLKIGGSTADTIIVAPRLDFSGASTKGIDIISGAQRTLIVGPRYDIGGGGSSLNDNGTDTLQIVGELLTKAPTIMGSLRVLDNADNPFVDFSTSGGQRGVIQISGALLDFFGASGYGMRFRTNGGTTVLQFGAGNTLGFYGASAVGKPSVSGSRGGNAALAILLSALSSQGLITDNTTA